ncbi:MAG: phosphatidylserine/phosphatidylglycerophosphate/cardiolipin synthase family protein [bacterium]|nr:phosphatidylserine/phosphatidylglycerophosphate/cardiolipin synthase family protein [bacterium]
MTRRSRFPLRRFWRRLNPGRRLLAVLLVCALVPAAGQVADHLAWDPAVLHLGADLAAAQPPAAGERLVLCLDGPEFMAAARADLLAAESAVLVQTLAFEADDAGLALAAALLASPAPRRRLLIDDYSRHVQSDKVIGAPNRLFDTALAREAEQTRTLVTQLRAHGVDVRYGRPLLAGGDLLKPRDHKKLVVVDGRTAYVGGINFSAHNFLWHDLMLRVDDTDAAAFLAADFGRSWQGEPVATIGSFAGLDLVCGSGGGHPAVRDVIAAAIAGATDRIVLQCPYVTDPYLELLGEARKRGVRVTVLTSERSNRFCMKQGIMDACRRHDLELRLLPGPMTHVKALLIDDRALVMGSANFDFLSGSLQPEIVATVADPAVIADFRRRVMEPDLVRSRPWSPDETSPVVTGLGAKVIGLAGDLALAFHEAGDR